MERMFQAVIKQHPTQMFMIIIAQKEIAILIQENQEQKIRTLMVTKGKYLMYQNY